MSIELINAVFKRGPKKLSQFAVMVALADNANDQGLCWPKLDLIARKSRTSTRNTMYLLKKLTADGWLTFEVRAHQHEKTNRWINRYQLNLQKLGLGATASPELISRENPSPELISRENPSGEKVSSEQPVDKPRSHGGKPVKSGRKTCA